ncbi:MAG: hypothetical protein ABI288_10395 [Ginsengibacter sp.]
MKTGNGTMGILESLILINGDRIRMYQKALKAITGNSSYESVFKRMIQQSINNRHKLIGLREGRGVEDNPITDSGHIYKQWTNVKSKYKGNAAVSSLEICEYNEQAAEAAYTKSLDLSINLTQEIREVIKLQKEELKESHDLIKIKWAVEKLLISK